MTINLNSSISKEPSRMNFSNFLFINLEPYYTNTNMNRCNCCMMSTDKKCLPRSSSCECVTYVIGREIAIKLNYRVFSLTWQASTQIYWNKRKRLHKKGVQLPQDWFGTPTWPPFHCFGTPIWPL